jgi:hypothetical protein
MSRLCEEDKKAVYNMMKIVDAILRKKGKYVGVAESTLDEAKRSAMQHHYNFLERFSIFQTAVDPYKILSWYGFYIAKHADDKDKISVLASMYVMNTMITHEPNKARLPNVLMAHLYQLVKNDEVDDDFGIGKNGIYAVFTAASMFASVINDSGLIVPKITNKK